MLEFFILCAKYQVFVCASGRKDEQGDGRGGSSLVLDCFPEVNLRGSAAFVSFVGPLGKVSIILSRTSLDYKGT